MKFSALPLLLLTLTLKTFAFQVNLLPADSVELEINEPSGLAFNPNSGTLYTHNDGLYADIYHISKQGIVLDSLNLNGEDFEGLAFNASYDTLFVVEELTAKIKKYTTAGLLSGEIQVHLDGNFVNGLEGITVNPADGHIFVIKEKEPCLLIELDAAGNELKRTELTFSSDVSGLAMHPDWQTLFILSAESRTLNETTPDGELLRQWSIPLQQAEGIAFNSNADTIYMVDDLNKTLYYFPFMETPFFAELYINEFMAGNSAYLQDEFGDYDDWIEIYNPNPYAVDIGGMYISDDFTNPALWQIPAGRPDSTTIPAEGYLVLWADKEPQQGVRHLDLRLSIDGEQIILTRSDLTTLADSVTFPVQQSNRAYGRHDDGAPNWNYFSTATPGESNSNGVISALKSNAHKTVRSFEILSNYPNPFNASTVITFKIQKAGTAALAIYDQRGRCAGRLVKQHYTPGSYNINWDASHHASGIYYIRLQTARETVLRKAVLLK